MDSDRLLQAALRHMPVIGSLVMVRLWDGAWYEAVFRGFASTGDVIVRFPGETGDELYDPARVMRPFSKGK